jgi:hypothetical protein
MTHFRLDTAFDVAARTAKVSTPLRSQAQSSEQTRLSKVLQMEFCGLALLRSIVLVPAPTDPHKLRRQCRANALSHAAPAIRPAEVSVICHAPPIPSPTSCVASARPLPNNSPVPSFRVLPEPVHAARSDTEISTITQLARVPGKELPQEARSNPVPICPPPAVADPHDARPHPGFTRRQHSAHVENLPLQTTPL